TVGANKNDIDRLPTLVVHRIVFILLARCSCRDQDQRHQWCAVVSHNLHYFPRSPWVSNCCPFSAPGGAAGVAESMNGVELEVRPRHRYESSRADRSKEGQPSQACLRPIARRTYSCWRPAAPGRE